MLNKLIENGWKLSEEHDDCVTREFRGHTISVTCFPCSDNTQCGCVLVEATNADGEYQSANCGTMSTGFPSLHVEEFNLIGDMVTYMASSIQSDTPENECASFSDTTATRILDALELYNKGVV